MNERIKELELAAIAYADSKVPANDRYNDIYHSIIRGKFAELIVQVCADYIDAFNKENMVEEGIGGDMLKQHFGVEE